MQICCQCFFRDYIYMTVQFLIVYSNVLFACILKSLAKHLAMFFILTKFVKVAI